VADGNALRHCAEELKADKGIVMCAVSTDGKALEHATPELRSDREVVMRAVTTTGQALRFASPDLRKHKDIVTAAVMQDGLALRWAFQPRLAKDTDLVLKAMAQDPKALSYAAFELWNGGMRLFVKDQLHVHINMVLCIYPRPTSADGVASGAPKEASPFVRACPDDLLKLIADFTGTPPVDRLHSLHLASQHFGSVAKSAGCEVDKPRRLTI